MWGRGAAEVVIVDERGTAGDVLPLFLFLLFTLSVSIFLSISSVFSFEKQFVYWVNFTYKTLLPKIHMLILCYMKASLSYNITQIPDRGITLSKFLCFLSRLAARPLALSTSTMRSSTSPWSLCLVLSREAHLELMASICSSASCRRWASFFLIMQSI